MASRSVAAPMRCSATTSPSAPSDSPRSPRSPATPLGANSCARNPRLEGSGGGEPRAKPVADHLVRGGSGGEVEVDEAMGLARVADLFHVDAVLAQTVGVRTALVAQ